MNIQEIINRLQSLSNPTNVQGMARFGISAENNLGVSVTTIRNLAKEIGTNHDLALQLWDTNIRDAQMLAASIDDPKKVTEKQLEAWAVDFNSWDLCDHCCGHLFDKTLFAYQKAIEWSDRNEEFVKRAGFALMAWLAVHDKKASDQKIEQFFQLITKQSTDEKKYVKKAVSWALRNIGKRSTILNKKAITCAKKMSKIDSKSARWIASDALQELTSEKVQKRLERKEKKNKE